MHAAPKRPSVNALCSEKQSSPGILPCAPRKLARRLCKRCACRLKRIGAERLLSLDFSRTFQATGLSHAGFCAQAGFCAMQGSAPKQLTPGAEVCAGRLPAVSCHKTRAAAERILRRRRWWLPSRANLEALLAASDTAFAAAFAEDASLRACLESYLQNSR